MMMLMKTPETTKTTSRADLNDNNVLIYAAKHYDKPYYITSEFEEDFKRIQYIQKLFCRYERKGELKERLILNHLIVLYNVFGAEPTARILFLRIDPKHHTILKTFLVYLNIMPDVVFSINGSDIISSNISLDGKAAQLLRKI